MAGASSATFRYDALGFRVAESGGRAPAGGLRRVFDERGHLLGEYVNGAALYEVIWLDDLPVAVMHKGQTESEVSIDYIFCDHLQTPVYIARAGDHVGRWQWDSVDAFGGEAPNDNPAGAGPYVFNLRFPGQIYSAATDMFYNVRRDYDPEQGRYVQPDPTGIAGGVNVYMYAQNDPVNAFDATGETPQDNHFGISDKGFWKWWEAEKRSYGPFDRSQPGFNPDKPYDLPNRDAAKDYYNEYKRCAARDERDAEAGIIRPVPAKKRCAMRCGH